MLPSSRSQSAATTALAGGTCELFRVKRLREIPDWWVFGRCPPPNSAAGGGVASEKLGQTHGGGDGHHIITNDAKMRHESV